VNQKGEAQGNARGGVSCRIFSLSGKTRRKGDSRAFPGGGNDVSGLKLFGVCDISQGTQIRHIWWGKVNDLVGTEGASQRVRGKVAGRVDSY